LPRLDTSSFATKAVKNSSSGLSLIARENISARNLSHLLELRREMKKLSAR
jgi:hypothetical protein